MVTFKYNVKKNSIVDKLKFNYFEYIIVLILSGNILKNNPFSIKNSLKC
jgi:hypothetical protein